MIRPNVALRRSRSAIKHWFCLGLFGLFSSFVVGQNNLITDKKLYNELYSYLLHNSNTYEIDELGNKLADSTLFPRGSEIACGILKTDSVIENKDIVGIYQFRFTCSSCAAYLYFLYPGGKKEFFNVYAQDFNFTQLIGKTETFIMTYCKDYSEKEKTMTKNGVVELIYSR